MQLCIEGIHTDGGLGLQFCPRREKGKAGVGPCFFIGQTAGVSGDLVAKGGQKCWVWFKGNPLEPDSGEWKAGWYGSVAPRGGISFRPTASLLTAVCSFHPSKPSEDELNQLLSLINRIPTEPTCL